MLKSSVSGIVDNEHVRIYFDFIKLSGGFLNYSRVTQYTRPYLCCTSEKYSGLRLICLGINVFYRLIS